MLHEANDFASLPDVLRLKEVCKLLRISESTLRRGLKDGTFRPLPWRDHPLRWLKQDIRDAMDAETRRRRFMALDRAVQIISARRLRALRKSG